MTTTAPDSDFSPGRLAMLLGRDPVQALLTALRSTSALDAVTPSLGPLNGYALRALRKQLAAAAAPLLDVDIGAVAVSGWQKRDALRRAAARTRDDPGRSEMVRLASHTIEYSQSPRLDIAVDDVVVAHLVFTATLELCIECLTAVVAKGRITAVEAGRCAATLTVTAGGVPLVEHHQPIDIAACLPIGDGITAQASRR